MNGPGGRDVVYALVLLLVICLIMAVLAAEFPWLIPGGLAGS